MTKEEVLDVAAAVKGAELDDDIAKYYPTADELLRHYKDVPDNGVLPVIAYLSGDPLGDDPVISKKEDYAETVKMAKELMGKILDKAV